jgi:[ribosomal protein S5]-alanine N-acetyltransferase
MPTQNFTSFPTLTTERLLLRKIAPDDVNSIFLLRSNEIVNKYIARVPVTTMDEAQAWIAMINKRVEDGTSINWAITIKDTGEVIGLICLWKFSQDGTVAETGYEMHPGFHGKGLMTEALNTAVAYGFETLNLQLIEAYTHRENANSIRLLVKNGFVWNKDKVDDGFPHNVVYGLELK